MKKINFNRGWQFCLNDGKDWDKAFEGECIVDLPHDFSIIQERSAHAPSGASGGFFMCGVGKYQKSFKAKKNKKYFLMCDGAFGITDVFVNANIAKTNAFGYNSFLVDMTKYLRYDKENEVLIRVNNNMQPNARWYAGSGLYRDVFLCECDREFIYPSGTFVTTKYILNNTAYLEAETIIVADRECEATVEFEALEEKNRDPVSKITKEVLLSVGENKVRTLMQIENCKTWSVDAPNLYKIKTTLKTDKSTDRDESPFGIRTILLDSKRGLLINGKSVKLRGGCIHHDQGIVGSAVYPETEYRRIAKLKEAGFNSVRLSHNPQSPYLYEACDRLGMLVIDELFDYWSEGKKESDFHPFFLDNYEKWTKEIILKNRNHPSIVMWSTGNEIPQKTGRGNGYQIAAKIAENIRNLDTSRPVTHALCSLWDDSEEYELEKAQNDFSADKMDYFAKKTAITADTCDLVGYNYLEYRLEKDLIRFPNRLFINTETFPMETFKTVKQQLANPRILGDYVWTAWDYFGETGIGHVEYNEKRGDFLLPFPYHIANCGDIDIIGIRKPQSYFREIAWGLRKAPYVAVRHPKLFNTPYYISGWGFYECEESWCFDGYEGKMAKAYVFADANEVALFVNGKEVDRKQETSDGVYEFDVIYTPGEIKAIAYKNGEIIGTHKIKTEGKAEKLCLKKEKNYIKGAKNQDRELIYVMCEAQDKNGARASWNETEVAYTIEGGKILGAGSGQLDTCERYCDTAHKLYRGRTLIAVLVERGAKNVVLHAKSNELGEAKIQLK